MVIHRRRFATIGYTYRLAIVRHSSGFPLCKCQKVFVSSSTCPLYLSGTVANPNILKGGETIYQPWSHLSQMHTTIYLPSSRKKALWKKIEPIGGGAAAPTPPPLNPPLVRGVHPMGGRSAVLHRNLRGERSTKKYTKFGPLIIRKIIKIVATRCHILRLKSLIMHQIWFLASVRLCLRCSSLQLWFSMV